MASMACNIRSLSAERSHTHDKALDLLDELIGHANESTDHIYIYIYMCSWRGVTNGKKGYAQGKYSPTDLLFGGSYGYSITLSRDLRDSVDFCVSIPNL